MADLAHPHFIEVRPGKARHDLGPLRGRAGHGHAQVYDRLERVAQVPAAMYVPFPRYAHTLNLSDKIG